MGQRTKFSSEKRLVEKIRKGDEHAFERLFFEYFYDLCSFALQMTYSNEKAKDIVQEVFFNIWRRRHAWEIRTSLKAYLFQSVRNEALNHIDREQHRQRLREEFAGHELVRFKDSPKDFDEVDRQLLDKIWRIVSEMPQRRRTVFILHRKHGLSYKEISQVLSVTRKTVENHIGLALKYIRENLDVENN